MSHSRQEVAKIAHLARLTLNEQAVSALSQDLEKILDLVAQINEINTDHIQPMAHPLEHLNQRLREDSVTEFPHREDFQAIAPAVDAGLYLVPKVIEELEDVKG